MLEYPRQPSPNVHTVPVKPSFNVTSKRQAGSPTS